MKCELRVAYVLEIETAATLPDARRTKSCAWTVGCARVKGSADEGDIVLHRIACKARVVLKTTKGRDAREDGIGLHLISHLSLPS